MKKNDCKIGMYVGVIQNINPLAKSRTRVKRIGKIVGVYDDFINLLLFDSNLSDKSELSELDKLDKITIKREMYIESFRFQEIFKLEQEITYEK